MRPRLAVALFGSPEFAIPTLEMLAARHDLRAVVAQSDKPAGRKLRPSAPAAARWARARQVPLLQPERLKTNADFLTALRALELDVAITAAYGKILPQSVLDVPREGVLNVHASLLPAYRGAAPVQWAIIDGRTETGVSIMQTEAGLDTGPVRHVRRVAIAPDDDARTLGDRLAHEGAAALAEALDALASGTLPSVPQDHARATVAPRLTRDEGRVRWRDTSAAVLARHRGVAVWPGSWTTLDEVTLKLFDLRGGDDSGMVESPGTVTSVDEEGLRVATGDGWIHVGAVQAPGRSRVRAVEWARGARVGTGARLG
jgi:methionyl-tRNA formyltransferase